MTGYKRGAIVLFTFPNSDLRTAKRRPALVLQRDGLDTDLPQVVVAMISSKVARADDPSRVLIPAGVGGTGLAVDSVVMTDNLVTVADAAIDRQIGTLQNLRPIEAALRNTFGLD